MTFDLLTLVVTFHTATHSIFPIETRGAVAELLLHTILEVQRAGHRLGGLHVSCGIP